MRVLIYSKILILLEKLREEERKTKMGILKKKALAFALSLLMVMQVVGIHAENTFAAGNSQEHEVANNEEFRKALQEAANGDVILINSSIVVSDSNNQDNVFVIDKQLTIAGNTQASP